MAALGKLEISATWPLHLCAHGQALWLTGVKMVISLVVAIDLHKLASADSKNEPLVTWSGFSEAPP